MIKKSNSKKPKTGFAKHTKSKPKRRPAGKSKSPAASKTKRKLRSNSKFKPKPASKSFALPGRPAPKDHYAVLPYLIQSGLDANQGMDLFIHWAKKDPKIGTDSFWDNTAGSDWSAAVSKVSAWTVEAMNKFARHPGVDTISILLGDSPEAFWVQAHPWTGGRAGLHTHLANLRKLTYLQQDACDWDAMADLGYYRTETLPGDIWKKQPFADPTEENEDDELPFDPAFALWDAISYLGVADALHRGKLNWTKILGDRTEVPLLIGYNEEPHLVCTLTPAGWKMEA